MTDAASQKVFLKDYTPFPFTVEKVDLTFRLSPKGTKVISRIRFVPSGSSTSLFLHGEKLRLLSAKIDGTVITPELSDSGLTVDVPNTPFTWEAEVEIDPIENTALEGLYMSNGMYCTQCEAEGFRKITYYPDRPDVLAPFDVRIEGEASVLLSNGNPTGSGEGWAAWSDPWPKPAYLFALVAGELEVVADEFTTKSGKQVALGIYVRKGDEHKCDYALDALKRSMTWDEDVYGREYDLDIFNIVAVDDFNMGAMENKGLNIFNSKFVLASPETATDRDYEFIEAIIAHEYFHNWTGNRITCRDWFQLCLKEGLTVFRDQQFTGDMRSHPVKRIDDVLMLRSRQFREDAGPLAHPVRPESFIEINNFYTATVYEKGAELIGVLKTLVGDEAYRKALDLYFERHDGDAATIEDWLKVFEDVTGRDLSQFHRWYAQAGTPRVTVEEHWDNGRYDLTFRQETPDTPGQTGKLPVPIPIAYGLLAPDGTETHGTQIFALTETEQTVTVTGLQAKPVPSLLRGFSAPVIIDRETPPEERLLLLGHDTDPFNRWEAGRSLSREALMSSVADGTPVASEYLEALERLVTDESLDPAFRALALGLPSQDDIAQGLFEAGVTPDPQSIYQARQSLGRSIGAALGGALGKLYDQMAVPGPYTPESKAAGNRALRQAALGLLALAEGPDRAAAQFTAADNMTEQVGALSALLGIDEGAAAAQAFYDQWKADRLVVDKWFSLQILQAAPHTAVPLARTLTDHPEFDWKTPNRFRSVVGALAGNPAGFHSADGSGYAFLTDWLLTLDPVNPQTTARMSGAFETWRRYDADRQGMIEEQLRRLLAKDGLSRDTTEMVTRILGA